MYGPENWILHQIKLEMAKKKSLHSFLLQFHFFWALTNTWDQAGSKILNYNWKVAPSL